MRNFVFDFIRKIGKEEEFRLFLDSFKQLPSYKFAVIKISGQTIENNLDIIAQDIAFLNKLEIFPIIIHGAGSALDKKLKNTYKVNGYRYTKREDIPVIKKIFSDIANSLSNKIIEMGGNATVVDNVFYCKRIEQLGYVGNIQKIDKNKIIEAVESDKTVIISPIGSDGKNLLNINADTAAKAIVKELGVKKFILLTETGGVLDTAGNIISFINISDIDEMSFISGGMKLKLYEIRDFLKENPFCEVVITSADKILQEIFTIKGSGTFIKFYRIFSTRHIKEVGVDIAKQVLENSFNKELVHDYLKSDFKEIFYHEEKDGIAIIKEVDGVPYLDKIAVRREKQGTGLGKSLWDAVIKKYNTLTWRSAIDNIFNKFYFKNCDGMIKKNNWIVYWKNLPDEKILDIVNKISSIKKTLIKRGKND